MVSPLVSKDIISLFEDRFKNYKYEILSKIHEKYLSNNITKEELFREYTIENQNDKPKLIIMAKNTEDMCMAKYINMMDLIDVKEKNTKILNIVSIIYFLEITDVLMNSLQLFSQLII